MRVDEMAHQRRRRILKCRQQAVAFFRGQPGYVFDNIGAFPAQARNAALDGGQWNGIGQPLFIRSSRLKPLVADLQLFSAAVDGINKTMVRLQKKADAFQTLNYGGSLVTFRGRAHAVGQ